MTVSTYKCDNPMCDRTLMLQRTNGSVWVSPQHFHHQHENKWFCDENCCLQYLRLLGDGAIYDERNDPDIGSGD